MLNEYEINRSTLAIIPKNGENSMVLEEEETYEVKKKPIKIIDNSCKYFGSSYAGRFAGSKKLLGNKIYKAPIIVEETSELIYFPTTSSSDDKCCWISLGKIKEIVKEEHKVKLVFKNKKSIYLDVSFESLNNQILRASRLESILRQNKINNMLK